MVKLCYDTRKPLSPADFKRMNNTQRVAMFIGLPPNSVLDQPRGNFYFFPYYAKTPLLTPDFSSCENSSNPNIGITVLKTEVFHRKAI